METNVDKPSPTGIVTGTPTRYELRLARRARRAAIRRGDIKPSAASIAARNRRAAANAERNRELFAAADSGDAVAISLLGGAK